MGKKALYNIKKRIAGFDFYNFAVVARHKGYDEIVFDVSGLKKRKWDKETVKKRFESIILPGPELLGMKWSYGQVGDFVIDTDPKYIVDFYRAGNIFRKIECPIPPKKVEYTVTIRNTQRAPFRNSNEPAWREFASEINAVLFDDFEKEPILLKERFSYYAGAKMNFFVSNGPGLLCILSPYPYMIFACNKDRQNIERIGVKEGENWPWAIKNQFNIWLNDDLPTIRRIFREWKLKNES